MNRQEHIVKFLIDVFFRLMKRAFAYVILFYVNLLQDYYVYVDIGLDANIIVSVRLTCFHTQM